MPVKPQEKSKPNYTVLLVLVVIALIISILALTAAIKAGRNNNTDACAPRLEQIETRMDEIEKVQSWQVGMMDQFLKMRRAVP